MRLRSTRSAIFESGLLGAWPGKTNSEILIASIWRAISTARADNGTRSASLRNLRSSGWRAAPTTTPDLNSTRPISLSTPASVRTFVKIRNSRARAAIASRARRSAMNEVEALVRKGRMTAPAQLGRRLKPIAFRSSQRAGLSDIASRDHRAGEYGRIRTRDGWRDRVCGRLRASRSKPVSVAPRPPGRDLVNGTGE